ncbi:MAG TPA: hypothetical protein VMT22_20685, partial [Terriglobales bacterium]|nr:hypothetical protein [Terriglobales bacterium]
KHWPRTVTLAGEIKMAFESMQGPKNELLRSLLSWQDYILAPGHGAMSVIAASCSIFIQSLSQGATSPEVVELQQ